MANEKSADPHLVRRSMWANKSSWRFSNDRRNNPWTHRACDPHLTKPRRKLQQDLVGIVARAINLDEQCLVFRHPTRLDEELESLPYTAHADVGRTLQVRRDAVDMQELPVIEQPCQSCRNALTQVMTKRAIRETG